MKKRLRKKKRIGGFAEKGCRLVVVRKTEEDSEAFNDAFILEAVEGNSVQTMSIYATLWKLKFPRDIFDSINGDSVLPFPSAKKNTCKPPASSFA